MTQGIQYKALKAIIAFIKNLLPSNHKYCNLIGYRTHYLSGDR